MVQVPVRKRAKALSDAAERKCSAGHPRYRIRVYPDSGVNSGGTTDILFALKPMRLRGVFYFLTFFHSLMQRLHGSFPVMRLQNTR